MIEHELKEIQVNAIRYKLLVIEFAGMVNHETLKGIPAKLSSIFYEMEGLLVLDIRSVTNLNSEFVRAFTGILHVISEKFTRYFIMTEDQKIYNWIMNYNKLREVNPVMNFDELKEALELDSLIQEFEF
ncbi:hypothetical protein LEP1GSC193_1511 [Leptospira alstonii serovar Pingchang str. 80-412]|uniref:STAS domain-containing protein n=3 Tax=Leptospira alstonii TaxID=28452 RepID=M6CXD8_9LEPT|nr:hypothetical protein LEP1GSC194_2085 [Leptospira alstonii serovar Sichuan str. 79601]EQA79042.1 hypothetical protein LEP1GSC193_1511 [Leptospira alstonii serovar Pingchang str. 80-412]